MKLPLVFPRQPFIGIALAAVLGIAFADRAPHPQFGLCLVIASAAIALVRRSSLATYATVFSTFLFLHTVQMALSPGVRLARELTAAPEAVTARGFVVDEPKISARGSKSFLLRLYWIERGGRARKCAATVAANWTGDVQFGDELQLFGAIQPLEPPRNPGEFDMRAYLARRDIHRILIARYTENGRILSRGGGNPIRRAAHASRKWMQATLARGLEDSPDVHGLISAMVLGLRDETGEEVEEQFQQTGTIHLFAVSGLHVGIVAYLLWTVATVFRIPRKWAVALIIPALF
ncbi:MAG: ComEC family competence protein, partial [Chthoniobacterales bacterium]|nr:ComEC family competence protein [Chthoniobacterales bacterium]